ncbi:hypothetical protein [Cupriavidus sp. UME77]|uniref:hypothetical protein n=1 Tax=Cupriavidus sp. UME77 TaxID=1862321 RepID=UPI00160437D9|nr:hypothetical protein [Cupriavidus sp. UME77]MBB1634335.1 hypothetical protein [Cupriavidus sp. UME77]
MTAHEIHRIAPLAMAASAIVLASCGGGDGASGGGSATSTPAPVVQARALSGTAATGAAFAGGLVSVIDATGAPACSAATSSLVTSDAGIYTCVLTDSARGPFAIVVSDPNNLQSPQVSLIIATPEAGKTGVANITPLTTAAVAIATGKLTLTELIGSAEAIKALTATSDADLKAALATLKAQLSALLQEAGLTDPATFDPVTTPIVAGSGQGADRLLDNIRVTAAPYDDGSGNPPRMVLMLSNPLAPAAAPVPLGSKGDTASVKPVPASTVSGVDFTATAGIGKQLQACFSHPVSERAISVDKSIPLASGGPEVTKRHADCELVPIEAGFINSGYRPWQYFYATMTGENMTGAKFSAPELMIYAPATGGDLIALNIKYVDNTGAGGNYILNARKQADGKWALTGNSRNVEVSVRPVVRRSEELVPTPETGVFWYSGASRFQTGLNIFVNRAGPGSTDLRAVRVKGYGLPAAGVVLSQPGTATCSDQTWFNIANKTGNINISDAGVDGAQYGSVFWLQRTRDIQGANATVIRPNPFASDLAKANQTANWSHPGDFGAVAGATSYIDFSKLGAWTRYTFEFFYKDETTPSRVLSAPIVSPVIPAAAGASLEWTPIDAATRDLLAPASTAAGSASTMTLSWTPNLLAEPVSSVGAYTYRFASLGDPATGTPPAVQQSVVSGSTPVPRGSTTVTIDAPSAVSDPNCGSSGQFIGLTSDGLTSRQLQLRYRMLNGTQKESVHRYN